MGEVAKVSTSGGAAGHTGGAWRWVVVVAAVLSAIGAGIAAYVSLEGAKRPADRTVLRPTGTILMSVRDLARLETNELHLEKVIDLSDKQSRLFGLIDTSDAILLVAAGDVTIGIDLGKVADDDFVVDREMGTARVRLPAPEILSVRLDEGHTYVYRRSTALLARRNEQLESKARLEAVRALEEAARDSALMEKAKKQAERRIRDLLEKLGVPKVTVDFKPS